MAQDKDIFESAFEYYSTLDESFSQDEIESIQVNLINEDQTLELGTILYQLANGYSIDECTSDFNEMLDEDEYLEEKFVRRVNAAGEISRIKDRKTRERMATITTGLSKARRREIARKTRRTKNANPSIGRRALRKRRKALLKRKAFGL